MGRKGVKKKERRIVKVSRGGYRWPRDRVSVSGIEGKACGFPEGKISLLSRPIVRDTSAAARKSPPRFSPSPRVIYRVFPLDSSGIPRSTLLCESRIDRSESRGLERTRLEEETTSGNCLFPSSPLLPIFMRAPRIEILTATAQNHFV